jgi:hypothetical protein
MGWIMEIMDGRKNGNAELGVVATEDRGSYTLSGKRQAA